MSNNCIIMDVVYLAWLREHVLSKKKIFKVGNTGDIFNRMKNYPKGSLLLHMVITPYRKIIETSLVRIFRERFIHRPELGREYFEGDFFKMRNIINEIVNSYKFSFPDNKIIYRHVHISAVIKIQYYWRKIIAKKHKAATLIQYRFRKYRNYVNLLKKIAATKIWSFWIEYKKNKAIKHLEIINDFVNNEIREYPVFYSDVKNIFLLRYPEYKINDFDFKIKMQSVIGPLTSKKGKLLWLNKKQNKRHDKNEHDSWKPFRDNFIVINNEDYIQWKDLRPLFYKWLEDNNLRNKESASYIKKYFIKHMGEYKELTRNNIKIRGFLGYTLNLN